MADQRTDRRSFLNRTLMGAACAGAFASNEEQILGRALAQQPGSVPASEHKAYVGDPLPHGQLGSVSVSRLILGGNLIGGFAHSRDLLYVSRLLREYNTDERIFQTLALAEKSGVNTIQLNPGCYPFIESYNKDHGGTIQAIVNVDVEYDDLSKVRDQVQDLVGRGAQVLYTHGMVTDRCVMNGQRRAGGGGGSD